MSFEYSMKFDDAWLQSIARTMPEKLTKALMRGVTRGADIIKRQISRNAGGEVLHRRTGLLARSFQVTPAVVAQSGTQAAIAAGVFNDATGLGDKSETKGRTPYADIQEYGGTVTPKNSKYLAVPVYDAKTPAGVARYRSPRDVPGLVTVHRKRDDLLMMGLANGKAFQALFILKKSVKIPASHYISRAFDDTKDRAAQEVEKEVNSMINAEVVRGLA